MEKNAFAITFIFAKNHGNCCTRETYEVNLTKVLNLFQFPNIFEICNIQNLHTKGKKSYVPIKLSFSKFLLNKTNFNLHKHNYQGHN